MHPVRIDSATQSDLLEVVVPAPRYGPEGRESAAPTGVAIVDLPRAASAPAEEMLPPLRSVPIDEWVLPGTAARDEAYRSASPRVSVVIPTLNEAANIGWVLRRIDPRIYEVIVVDGRSTDGTPEIASAIRSDVRVLEQTAKGKGAALALGLSAAMGDIVVMIDADGSMDPAEIPAYVGALLAGADVVKGSRELSGGGSHDLSPLRRAGNRALTWIANRVYRQRWRELCYGYAAFWKDVVPVLGLPELASASSNGQRSGMIYGHGFEIEALMFCRSARAGLRVAEVFSFEHARRNGESNLLTWRDGWRVLTALGRESRWDRRLELADRRERCYPAVPYLHNHPIAADFGTSVKVGA